MPGCNCNPSLIACNMKLGNRFQSSDVITQKCQLSKAVDFNKENRCRCQDQFPAKKRWACRECVRHRKIDWYLLFICHSSSACLYASVDSLITVSQTHTHIHIRRSRCSNAFWCHLVWQTLTHTGTSKPNRPNVFAKYAHPAIFTPYRLPYGLPETSTSPIVVLGHQPPNLQWHLGSMGIN